MTFDHLILNGTLVTGAGEMRADIGLVDGIISAIGPLAGAPARETFDATDLHVLPGLIDTQVHFREPGMEHKEDLESGTRAAIAGGVTTIFEMPNTNPTTTTAEALADKVRRATGRAWCDFAFFVGAAQDNVGELRRLETLPGASGIKIFMGSSTGTLLIPDDDTLRAVLQNGQFPVPVHSEDHQRLESRKTEIPAGADASWHPIWRDAECARLATERLIRMCRETGRPVHVLHVSDADELPLIARAKAEGLPVTAEVTPQHLWFAAPDAYERLGTRAQMNPPIRDDNHRQALRAALAAGLFDVFGSDHAPHTLAEKALPYPQSPSGMPGVQTMLPVLATMAAKGLTGSLSQVVRMGCERPAELYSIARKGFLREGYDADLVITDLNHWESPGGPRSQIQSKCGWTPYEGEPLTGWPVRTYLRGQLVWNLGQPTGIPGGRVVTFAR